MKIAVTAHAVKRFLERAEGILGFDEDSVRAMIRRLVSDGYEYAAIRDHPIYKGRRIIPFKSGKNILYLSIGKNTTQFPGDIAVIGVLYERDVTGGRVGVGAVLGDKVLDIKLQEPSKHPLFRVFIGEEDTIESYQLEKEEEVENLLEKRQADPSVVAVYKLWDR